MNVYFLLDRSGSMESMWTEALGSINGYVKKLPNDTRIMLAAFDTISHDVLRNTVTEGWKDLTREEVNPRGGTPLFDSAVRVMTRILDDNPERAMFIVMTDGEENSSQTFKQAQVLDFTNKLKAKNYEVIFLGANFEKVGDVAKSFGVDWSKTVDNKMGAMRHFMTENLAIHTSAYAATGQAINFTDDDRKAASTPKSP